ncbi:MAG: hypothetical protein JWM53_1481 [bacterium]|nr:hypothetical protein [bacterium]
MSQFAEYVQVKNLTVDSIFYCSARIEGHRVEDRKLRLGREQLRRKGSGSDYAGAGLPKPRSGRGLSRKRIAAAIAGQPLAPRVRAKLRRAVAALVERSGGEPPDLTQLFGDVHSRHGGAAPAAAIAEQA